MSKKIFYFIIGFFVGIIFLGWGLILGGKAGYYRGFLAGYDFARQKVVQSNLFPALAEVKTISGTIKKIENQTIFLTAENNLLNPLEKTGPVERRVKVIPQTKIMRSVLNLKNIEIGAAPIQEIKINLSDLKVGQRIVVGAGQDIKFSPEFKALKITAPEI